MTLWSITVTISNLSLKITFLDQHLTDPTIMALSPQVLRPLLSSNRCTTITISSTDRTIQTPPTSGARSTKPRVVFRSHMLHLSQETRMSLDHLGQLGSSQFLAQEEITSKGWMEAWPRSSFKTRFKSWSRTTRSTLTRTKALRSCTSTWNRCSLNTLRAEMGLISKIMTNKEWMT